VGEDNHAVKRTAKVVEGSHAALKNGIDAYEAIDKGLADGMDRAGQ
jgi:methanogenic corrinoid protein MtbC1